MQDLLGRYTGHSYTRLLLLALLKLAFGSQLGLAAGTLVLENPPLRSKVGRFLQILKTDQEAKDIDQAQKLFDQGNFVESTKDSVSLGYRGEGIAWARIILHNPKASKQKIWMISRYSSIDFLTVFVAAPDGTWTQDTQGDNVPISQRPFAHRLPIFALDLAPGITTVYLKMETTSALLFDLELWDTDVFVPYELQQTTIVGVLFGVCLIMLFYNFFVFLKFHDRSYLYYSLYIASYLTFAAWYHGLAQLYVFPDLGKHWLFRQFLFHVVDAITITALAFSIEFLQLQQRSPKLYKLLRFMQGFAAFNIVLTLAGLSLITSLTLLLNFASSLVLILVGAWISLQFRPARYYTLGWLFLLGGNMLQMSTNQGLLTANTFTYWAQFSGAALELLLLSLALGERVALINKEREDILRQQKILQEEAFKLEKEAREANERALAEEKKLNEQRDQLVANTSHELRTPLNGMMGLAQAILRRDSAQLSEASIRSLNGLLQSGQRLAALIGDLLDFSRGQKADIQLYRGSISIREQLDFVLLILEATLEKQKLELRNQIRSDLPRVFADPQRIQQIFFNLLGNAIKFTEQGSITVSASIQDEHLIIRVKDTGIGIEEEAQRKIFEAFTQANGGIARRFGGTGLGLAIVRELILAHGGEVGVQSVPGFGSTFWFSLPLAKDQEQLTSQASQSLSSKMVTLEAQLQAGGQTHESQLAVHEIRSLDRIQDTNPLSHPKLTILVVDDELMNRQVLGELLQIMGHRAICLGRGLEALQWIEEFGKPDLLLLDIMMPELSGYEVLSELRKKYNEAELPILILSAKALEKDLMQGFALGASDYILKPFSASEVESRILHQARLKQAIETSHRAFMENQQLRSNLDLVEDQLLHAERLASVGAAIAGIAHEIGNPLQHLKTLIHWLEQDIEALKDINSDKALISQTTQKHVALSYRSIDTILDISRSLRVVSRTDQGQEEQVDAREVALDAQTILRHKLKKFRCEIEIEEGLVLRGKRSEFIQLLCNLLGNAADALEESHADLVRLRIFRQDHGIHILVEDAGKGIPDHLQEKIFEPFFTTKKAGHGTGLGLAVVRTLSRKWQAELRVGRSSTLGGASFDIILPVAS